MITEADLYGEPAAAAEKRAKAWAALCKWIKMRCARKRGVNVSNVFQLFFEVTGKDGGTSVRRPVFMLSERFCENYQCQPLYPPEVATAPPVTTGDDLNFYELAIQYSQNLSKDECFVALREMLFKVGEAVEQGGELRVDFGAGTLVANERRVSFEFAPSFGGGPRPARQRQVSADPMLNPKGLNTDQGLRLAGFAGAAAPAPRPAAAAEPVGGSVLAGGSGLSAEEEARLFAEVDQLDPEERAAAAEAAFADWRGDDLAPDTRKQIGRVLGTTEEQLASATLDDVGGALAARAAALEKQLLEAQQQTRAVETQLKHATSPRHASPLKQTPAAARAAADAAAAAAAAAAPSMGGFSAGLAAGSLQGGGLQGSGMGGGGGVARPPPSKLSASRGKQPLLTTPAAAGPALSIGFGAEGSAAVAAPPAVAKPPPRAPSERQSMGRHGPPIVTKADSSLLSGGAKQPSSKVAVAPPLGPYRYSAPAPQDAANTAWRLYAAPEAPVPAKGAASTRAKPPRPAGGLAPPHLDAPVSLNARR